MFLYIYVDHLFLYKPGVVDDILAGIVWEFDISQTFVTSAIALLAATRRTYRREKARPASRNLQGTSGAPSDCTPNQTVKMLF